MLHFELHSTITSPMALARWDAARNLPGTGIFSRNTMLDGANGNASVPFAISVPSLLVTSGHLLIRQTAIDSTHAVYANARILLYGPYASASLVPGAWTQPFQQEISLAGTNIFTQTDHYANPNLASQTVLTPTYSTSYYRLELYAASGNDNIDVDGLAELLDFNGVATNQFSGIIYPLSL